MNIACISASQVPTTTANSIQVMKACGALVQLGHQVHLLVPGSTPAPWELLAAHYGLPEEYQAHFTVEWLPGRNALKRYDFALTAVKRARETGAQLAWTWPLQAGLAALLARLPVVLEMHGPPEGRFGPLLFNLFLRTPGTKRLLPITRALVGILERDYRRTFSPGELVVAPNGVELERYLDLPAPAEARRRLGLRQAFTAGYTGHLYPGRGVELLAELAERFPQFQFLWVGGKEEDVRRWRERLKAKGVANVVLTGFIENTRLPLYQATADVLLMPYERHIAGSSGGNSAAYCSPMKLFEYLACGRAILSSDLPVIREVLDEQSAMLRPPEQVEVWAEALLELAENPLKREELAVRAGELARQYTWKGRAERALDGLLG